MKADWTKAPNGATHFWNHLFFRVQGNKAEFYCAGSWTAHREDARMLVIRPACEKAPV
jgi:hypothetical protein